MAKSFRVTIRFNPEYDSETINKIKNLKNRERSKTLRRFIREGFGHTTLMSDKRDHTLSDKIKNNKKKETKVVKWNLPL